MKEVFLNLGDLDHHLFWIFNLEYLAFSVETVFTKNGPAVTRKGLLTYLRSKITRDPDEAFTQFSNMNEVLKVVPLITRSQFPRLPDPQAKELALHHEKLVIDKFEKIMELARKSITVPQVDLQSPANKDRENFDAQCRANNDKENLDAQHRANKDKEDLDAIESMK
ncbi:hypothetical protein BGZ83_002901, partial [Gryganskiella cystojenkinii]